MRKIGIDFGTCNIKGAEKKKNGDITYVKLGKQIDEARIPNVIAYEQREEDSIFYIGEAALKKPLSECDKVKHIKSYLQEANWERKLSFGKVVNGYDVTKDIMSCLYKEIYNTNKNEELSATITVPVNFSKRQQLIVERAAQEAGFQVDAVITEPFAALFFLMRDHLEDEDSHRILIFDFGGGTLDLCLAEIRTVEGRIKIEVQSTVGISYGGDNLDEDILNHIVKERYPEQVKRALEQQENRFHNAINRYHIMDAIESVKAELFEEDDVKLTKSAELITTQHDGNVSDFGEIEVSDIYKMLRKHGWQERLFRLLDKLFDNSDFIPMEITDIFTVGGTSSIPLFRDMITDYFVRYKHEDVDALFELNDEMDREERLYTSVAAGAAIYNELIDTEEMVIKDKIPFMIYTKNENGKICSKLMKDDYFKDYSSALAPITEWMQQEKKIGVYQTIFGEEDKEVFLGYIPLSEDIAKHATLYRLTVDRKRTIGMDFGYLLTGTEVSDLGFCREWYIELKIEIEYAGEDRE